MSRIRVALLAALLSVAVGCSSSAPAAALESTPNATPAAAQLFVVDGSGDRELYGPFTTKGNWAIDWSYDCARVTDGHNWLMVAVYRQSDSDSSNAGLFDSILPLPGGELSGVSLESSNTSVGPTRGIFFLKITSECHWHLSGRPA